MTLLGVGSFLRIHNEITRGISGGGPKKPSGRGVGTLMSPLFFSRENGQNVPPGYLYLAVACHVPPRFCSTRTATNSLSLSLTAGDDLVGLEGELRLVLRHARVEGPHGPAAAPRSTSSSSSSHVSPGPPSVGVVRGGGRGGGRRGRVGVGCSRWNNNNNNKKRIKHPKVPIKIYSHSRGRSPPTADDVNRDTRDDTPSPLANLLLGLLSSGALAEAISDILGAADGGDE